MKRQLGIDGGTQRGWLRGLLTKPERASAKDVTIISMQAAQEQDQATTEVRSHYGQSRLKGLRWAATGCVARVVWRKMIRFPAFDDEIGRLACELTAKLRAPNVNLIDKLLD